jgi:hypothetical protein
MKYTILVEKNEGHYQASVPALPGCVAEGMTRANTLEKIQQAIIDRLSKVEITTIDVETVADPWEPFIGMWKEDSTWDEFQAEILAYRNEMNEEETDVS